MKKLILIGRSESGKSTLIQALRGETIHYHKTQYVGYGDFIIDTPGEYAEDKHLGGALAVYSYEADVNRAVQPVSAVHCRYGDPAGHRHRDKMRSSVCRHCSSRTLVAACRL